MIGRGHHLQEEQLFDCYLAEQSGGPPDPPAAEHLAACDECDTRYGELVRFMDGLREEAAAESDEIFTPERLQAQQRLIARRIDHVGRPARVISFPGRLVTRRMNPSGAHGVTRWIYAAAAAGLAVGLGLGVVYESASRQAGSPRTAHFAPAGTAGTSPAPNATDDAFLSDLEASLDRPGARELQPFDALTPHVREIRDNLR